jgi:hypothetical protein
MRTDFRCGVWRNRRTRVHSTGGVARLAAVAALAVTCAAGATAPAWAADARMTRTSGHACQARQDADLTQTHCTGLGRYTVVISSYAAGGMSVSFPYAGTVPAEDAAESFDLMWRGKAPFVGDRIEWRLSAGKPFAAIIRIYAFSPDDRAIEQLLIAKVSPEGACEIGRIDAVAPNAHDAARHLADSQASSVLCGIR